MTDNIPTIPEKNEFIFYQTQDGKTQIQVKFQDETVWLSQAQMSELFAKSISTINEHIKNVYEENELNKQATIRKFRIVQIEGIREVAREVTFYNLDIIISVGYRVKSHRGTQFRQWATGLLREYLIKGFTMDDVRLKQAGGDDYFDELLGRIRDIRSSEKVFWRKILDIYATSIDYDPNIDASQKFFKIVQNKMHWAVHGHTAPEIIKSHADANKPNMGLTSHTGKTIPKKEDTKIAKNYLSEDELDTLNRIVSFYLEFAELQAKNRKSMTMNNWITKLDDFLRLSDMEILNHGGTITHDLAIEYAYQEHDKYKVIHKNQKSLVEQHFEQAINQFEITETEIKKLKSLQKKK